MDDYGVYLHEAAHAVVGYYLGVPPKNIHIDNYEGYVEFDRRYHISAINQCIILFAGSCAEHLWAQNTLFGPTDSSQITDEDWEDICKINLSPDILINCKEQTYVYLKKCKNDIFRVADYLYEGGKIKNQNLFKKVIHK